MIKRIDHTKMGKSDRGWLKSIFHFSFAEYYNPENIHFGPLRVLNDDLVKPGTGFDTHPHRDMEIISYVVQGHLTHADSMGNSKTLKRGDFQYMSAGTGILHSEHNRNDDLLRFLQIWIIPEKGGLTPRYGDKTLPWEDRLNKLMHIVSKNGGGAPIEIYQDANIYVSFIEKGKSVDFNVGNGRGAYFVTIEGEADLNGSVIPERDAAEITDENLKITALKDSHVIILEMPAD